MDSQASSARSRGVDDCVSQFETVDGWGVRLVHDRVTGMPFVSVQRGEFGGTLALPEFAAERAAHARQMRQAAFGDACRAIVAWIRGDTGDARVAEPRTVPAADGRTRTQRATL